VQRFLNEARSYPRLTEEQEKELIQRVREQGDLTAARKLVVHNLRLVVSIAYQYRQAVDQHARPLPGGERGADGGGQALGSGRWGRASARTPAYWIRAMILRFLMTNARLIHVGNTRAGRKLFFRLEKERQKLLAAGFEPTTKLLAAKLDVAEADVIEVAGHLASREVSIEPRPDDDGVGWPTSSRARRPRPRTRRRAASCRTPCRHLMDKFEAGPDRRARAGGVARAPGRGRRSRAAGGAGRALRRVQAAHGSDRRQAEEALQGEILSQLGQDIQLSWQQSRSAE
jgi:hypothetical protein